MGIQFYNNRQYKNRFWKKNIEKVKIVFKGGGTVKRKIDKILTKIMILETIFGEFVEKIGGKFKYCRCCVIISVSQKKRLKIFALIDRKEE